jgi:5-carboxymethyl-2-hydroxymuconate isomerase
MKLLRYGPLGQEKPGLLDADGRIRDLSGHIHDLAHNDLSRESFARIATLDPADLPLVEGNPRLGACVGGVGKFICIGLNYSDHAAETNAVVPPEPIIFMKATSAIHGPSDDVIKPRGSTKMDWEVELAVVIGRPVAYADEIEAAAAIAGYCVCNDLSERAFQTERHGQWTKGKSCDTFGPIGPWLVTPDEAGDVGNLHMWLEVNGKRYQDGNSSTMVYKPAFIVSYLSQFMSLQPGDVISTGTPPGVGMGQRPPVYLEVGDVMALGIEGLGIQHQTVLAPTAEGRLIN